MKWIVNEQIIDNKFLFLDRWLQEQGYKPYEEAEEKQSEQNDKPIPEEEGEM